jgi:hypothetical protein
MHRERGGEGDGEHHRVEILVGVERDLLEHRRVDDEIVDGDQDRIAVGRHPCRLRRADIARRAGDVLNQEIAAEVFGQPLGDEAGREVGRAAGRERHDDAHRPRRIGLRPCRGCRGGCGRGG